MPPTKQDLLAFLTKLKAPQSFIDELDDDFEFTIVRWNARSKEDWLRRRPDDGDDIYNFLNPHQQGAIGFLQGSNDRAIELLQSIVEKMAIANDQSAVALDLQLTAQFPLLSERSTVNQNLKIDAAIFYGLVPTGTTSFSHKQLRCMLLGIDFPPSHVILSHVFQRNWQKDKASIHLDDIDNARNTVFLYKPIEHHFDHGNLVLLWEPKSKSFVCKLLNQELRSVSLDDCAKKYCDRKVSPLSTGKTLGDLDGLSLKFVNDNRPFKRCFAFHALVVRREAAKQGYIKSEDEVVIDDSMWSDVQVGDSMVKSWLATGYTIPSKNNINAPN